MARTRIRWRKGDLGRFEVEDPNAPRFEVISVSKERNEVSIWYGGQESPTTVPIDTFRKDCVNWWVTATINPPEWLEPGVTLGITGPGFLTQAIVAELRRGRKKKTHLHQQVDIRKALLRVRSIRKDYASCVMSTTGQLLMVPTVVIEMFGHISRSRYAVVSGGDDPFEVDPLEDINDLFGDGST